MLLVQKDAGLASCPSNIIGHFASPPHLALSLLYKDRRPFLHHQRFAHRRLVRTASQSYIVKCLIDIAEVLFERAKILKLA
jgi:hypothetical protein